MPRSTPAPQETRAEDHAPEEKSEAVAFPPSVVAEEELVPESAAVAAPTEETPVVPADPVMIPAAPAAAVVSAPAASAPKAEVAPPLLPQDSEVPAEILEFFVPEVEEHLQVVTNCLLSLETNPSPEEINHLLRAMHTVKGSAAQVGLQRIARVAHRAEDLIGRLRAGALRPSLRFRPHLRFDRYPVPFRLADRIMVADLTGAGGGDQCEPDSSQQNKLPQFPSPMVVSVESHLA